MLDDAMHNNPVDGEDKLKIWGFWNILGEEYFGAEYYERVRPPYYAWSLLCRYIPAGCRVIETTTTGSNDVRVATVELDGKYSIAMINISQSTRSVELNSETLSELGEIREYRYVEGDILLSGELKQLPNSSDITMNLKTGYCVELPASSMILFTNIIN